MTVWDLGNKLLNATNGKNLIAKLPADIKTTKDAKEFIGLCALLEVESPAPSKSKANYFTKK